MDFRAGSSPVARTRKTTSFDRNLSFFNEAFPSGTWCRFANDVTLLMMCCFATLRNASHHKWAKRIYIILRTAQYIISTKSMHHFKIVQMYTQKQKYLFCSCLRIILLFSLILNVLDCFCQYPLRSWPKPFRNNYTLIPAALFAQIFIPRKSISPFGIVGLIDLVPAIQAKFCHTGSLLII